MNPLAVAIAIGVAVGASMFLRKRGGVVEWLDRFWAGDVQPPAAFVRRMTDACTWLVDAGDVVSAAGQLSIDIAPNPGSEVRAPTDCIVSWVGTVAGRGPSVGLSSLHYQDECFLFVGVNYSVGLGQFVAGDDVIGQAKPGTYRTNETIITFAVKRGILPDPELRSPLIDAHAWLRENGTQVTRYIRGWA